MKLTYALRNFKAFKQTGDIEIAPITLLCGVNSSGKSSILKSLLLVKQSSVERRSRLYKDTVTPPLLFNGEWTRLGSYSDTVHMKSRNTSISIKWGANGRLSEMAANLSPYIRRFVKTHDRHINSSIETEFRSDPSVSEELSAYVARSTVKLNDLEISLEGDGQVAAMRAGYYRLTISSLRGLLDRPESMAGRFITREMRELVTLLSKADASVVTGNVKVRLSGPYIVDIEPHFDGSWNPFFARVLALAIKERAGARGRVPTWYLELHNAVSEYRNVYQSEDSDPDALASTRVARLQSLAESIMEDVSSVFGLARSSFSPLWKQIRYLGPLRHQPQRYYQFDDTGGVDIGVSGEFTVQVLALEADNSVISTPIETDLEGRVQIQPNRQGTLLTKTNYWLDRMGLPAVEPAALRQSLYEMKVGKLGVALPDVGFGVSQVLPIVVESLRAVPGDTVVLEQPEIHLHPRVQASLADFLLARALDGVRYIVETHSDIMVKRFCRRISEATVPKVDQLIKIYFISGEFDDGSRCLPVTLSQYGEIENWPDGFFDEGEDLYWTRAALMRRSESLSPRETKK
jgi:predicted ATPase